MDNKKIGKLIAKLRNEKGMTQQELGDKVGVGFRAVSKWERGLTLPDIAIINELSSILGITSDELLTGELNKPKKKNNPKFKILIISIITLITISIITFGIIFLYQNKTYVYGIECVESDKYYIDGQVLFQRDNITIIINKLDFLEENVSQTIVQDYQYDVISNEKLLFGYGYHPSGRYIENGETISHHFETFRVNYTGKLFGKKEEFINNDITLVISFIDQNNNTFSKTIEFKLIEKN